MSLEWQEDPPIRYRTFVTHELLLDFRHTLHRWAFVTTTKLP
jgi:hypothetical protein